MQGIHTQWWEPAGKIEAIVVIVHGAGEHIGRYAHVVHWFLEQGIAVLGGDLPGLGRSGGRRGHIDDFAEYVRTVQEWVEDARSRCRGIPIFLFGHSMGGLVVARLLQQSDAASLPLQGALLSSPCLGLQMTVPRWKQRLAAFLDRVAPAIRIPNGIASSDVSRTPDIVAAYTTDPYIVSRVSVRWFTELQKAMHAAIAEAARVAIPVFVLQAEADRLVDPVKSVQFIEKVAALDKKINMYLGLYHELLNEPEKRQVFDDMAEWISARK